MKERLEEKLKEGREGKEEIREGGERARREGELTTDKHHASNESSSGGFDQLPDGEVTEGN